VRVHDLIAKGVAEARRRNGWTQERTAAAFRYHGLTAWRTSTVGSLEAGLRRPRLDELLLMARALQVTLDALIPGEGEEVELGNGAVVSARWIREMLAGGFHDKFDEIELDDMPFESFPGDEPWAESLSRAEDEHRRLRDLTRPVAKWDSQHQDRLRPRDLWALERTPTDAERHAGRRLGVEPTVVKLSARALWGRDFEEERDARVGDTDQLEPRSLQARRGLVTREMLAEMRQMLDEAYDTRADETQQPIVAAIVTSRRGVLITARRDGKPPWGFVTGEVEPGEQARDAAVREVKEETGLEVRFSEVIGERDHPRTSRHMIYMAARPVRGTKVFIGDEAELSEVCWASLAEAEELMPDMFGPVHDHLVRVIGGRGGEGSDG
jgi:8-oxo-dGTP pyrophosphatase MutT (NUDIX family)/transcriptional regulator with XRE-family HTH domain